MADRPVTKLDKSAVLSGLFAVWDDIDALLAGLSEAQWRAASPLPGWDVKALVAHMIGTESFLAGIAAPQPDIDVSTLGHVRNDVGVMNECWVRHLSAHADADVLESFRAITTDRRQALTSLSGEEWDAVTMTPTGPDSYGRFMRIRVFELASIGASLAVDEIAATMGYVVGKLAKAPDGSRVQFDLTGPLARTVRVSVDGRAAVVDDFGDQEPTATIRLDGLQFTRLTGGRPMCPARAQDIQLDGDRKVATQIVEHLNFVI
jgi:uncharacterized protein (TIGR03083 family)